MPDPSAAAAAASSLSLPSSLQADDLPTVFADVTPIPQNQQKQQHDVCRIEYKPDFVRAYNYFRAVAVGNHEISERALLLTELCVQLNPANYTVWQYRRKILRELLLFAPSTGHSSSTTTTITGTVTSTITLLRLRRERIEYDLQLASRLGGDNPKNYQIWYHRRAILQQLLFMEQESNKHPAQEPEEEQEQRKLIESLLRSELSYLDSVIDVDGKNYHAWSHRQWVVTTLSDSFSQTKEKEEEEEEDRRRRRVLLWQKELDYTTQLIEMDGRNNSAWNHRWFVVVHNYNNVSDSDSDSGCDNHHHLRDVDSFVDTIAKRETSYALSVATLDAHNESPWRYFVAMVKEHVRRCSMMVMHANSQQQQQQQIRQLVSRYEQQVWDVWVVPRQQQQQQQDDDDDDAAAAEEHPPLLLATVVDLLELMLSLSSSNSSSSFPVSLVFSTHTTTTNDNDNDDDDDGDDRVVVVASLRHRIVELCERLVTLDPIRQTYWKWRSSQHATQTTK